MCALRKRNLNRSVFVCILSAGVVVLIAVCSIVYACTVNSVSLYVSDISPDDAETNRSPSTSIPVGDTAYFYAVCTIDENPDEVGIEWTFDLDGDGVVDPNDGTYESTDTEPYDSNGDYLSTTDSHDYDSSGQYTVRVKARLDDAEDDWEGPATCTVTVVGVEKVVKAGTSNEGPIVAGAGTTVDLEGIPDPNTATFPDGEPTWAITAQPAGSDPNLSSTDENTTLSGLDVPGDYVVEATCGTDSNSITITVHEVVSVVWETYPDDVNVPAPGTDHGPNIAISNGSGGKIIFSGKKHYEDVYDEELMRRKVTVKATVTPAVENVTVYFKQWDVDDPSDNLDIDDNDDPDNDEVHDGNFGHDNLPGIGQYGSLSATSAPTDASGVAKVTLTLGTRPGDNFKVTASTSSTRLGEVTQPKIDGRETPFPDNVERSVVLTVWRKLHVEVDSMGLEYDTGTASTGLTDTTLTDSGKSWADNQFNSYSENWDLQPDTSETNWYDVTDTSSTVITAGGGGLMSAASSGDPYKVEFKGFPADDTLRGDIPQPDISAFAGAFDDAYITVVEDTGNDDTATPWHHNFGGSQNDQGTYVVSCAGSVGYGQYMLAYIIGVYEDFTGYDNDPDTEEANFGGCALGPPGGAPDYAFVNYETFRDTAAQHGWSSSEKTHALKATALHEIGHSFGLVDDPGAGNNTHIMWQISGDSSEDNYKDLPLIFRPADIRKIRKVISP